jgi:hypothetical protein
LWGDSLTRLKLLSLLEGEPLSNAENAANEGVFGDCNAQEEVSVDRHGELGG